VYTAHHKFETAWWTTPVSSEPPEMFTFLPPVTLPSDAPCQLLSMFSLASLPVNAQPVLAVYLAGEWSTYLMSQTPKEIVHIFEVHYLPCLPNYTDRCTVLEVYCTNWTNDPFSYGSYTHIPVGSLDGVNDLHILGEQIVGLSNGKGGLWFAGEHAGTSDLATVNGAMTSGSLAATEILKSFGEVITPVPAGEILTKLSNGTSSSCGTTV
jgi:Flavin containing amine oxidoreductase